MPNLLLQTDSYKLTHWRMYPAGTETVYSYFESREGARFPETVFFGLQAILDEYLQGTARVPDWAIDATEELVAAHLGDAALFNRAGWEHIRDEHYGRLPLRIRAVPEGTVVPVGNVMMTVENTDPRVPWLTNYVESLLTHVWYPSTVATLSRACRKMFERALDDTADTRDALPFMLHDFGYRGVSSEESAQVGGAAHLINFSGTDTLAGMRHALDYYDADLSDLAFSVPATEHSIMTALGYDGEYRVLDSLLAAFPTGILSVVADSYDIYSFTKEVCSRAAEIKAREGRFVLRPDSTTATDRTPHELVETLLEILWEGFGGATNQKGYRVLDDHVRVLWGDGVDYEEIGRILASAQAAGFSAENLVFGMGGGLLQKVNRDTQRFAFKASWMERNGIGYDVWKDPLDTSKLSKAGRLALVRKLGTFDVETLKLRAERTPEEGGDLMVPVFEDGRVLSRSTFAEIRERANG